MPEGRTFAPFAPRGVDPAVHMQGYYTNRRPCACRITFAAERVR